MSSIYEDLGGKYVIVYTNMHTNHEFAGKVFIKDDYLELDPGYNIAEISAKLGEGIKIAMESDPLLKFGIGKEEALKELGKEMTVPKLAEQVGNKIRIPLERIVAVAQLKIKE